MTILDIKDDLYSHFLTLNTTSGIQFITEDNVCDKQSNITFIQPSDKRWFELSFLADNPDTVTIGSDGLDRYAGIYQIDICVPLESGKLECSTKFEWINKIFRRGQFIGDNSVLINKCYLANESAQENHYRMTVRVEWTVDIEIQE